MVQAVGFLFHLLPEQAEFLLQPLGCILGKDGELRDPIRQLAAQSGTEPVDRGLKESLRSAHHESGAISALWQIRARVGGLRWGPGLREVRPVGGPGGEGGEGAAAQVEQGLGAGMGCRAVGPPRSAKPAALSDLAGWESPRPASASRPVLHPVLFPFARAAGGPAFPGRQGGAWVSLPADFSARPGWCRLGATSL